MPSMLDRWLPKVRIVRVTQHESSRGSLRSQPGVVFRSQGTNLDSFHVRAHHGPSCRSSDEGLDTRRCDAPDTACSSVLPSIEVTMSDAIPALSELAIQRGRAFWRHLAWQLVPESFVGAPGAEADAPLPGPSEAALLAMVRGLHDKDVSDDAQRNRDEAQARLHQLVAAGPAAVLARSPDDDRPFGRLDLACELLQFDGQARLALELIVVTATDPVTTHAARILAGRIGRQDALSLPLLADCWNAAGLGAGTLTRLCAERGRLVRCGAISAPTGRPVRPTASLLSFLDDRYDDASSLGEHRVHYSVPLPAVATFQQLRAPWLSMATQMLRGRQPLLVSGRPGFGGPALMMMIANDLDIPCQMVHAAPLLAQDTGNPSALMAELHAEARLSGCMVVLHHVERIAEHFQAQPDSLRRFAAALVAIQRPLVFIHEGPVSNDLASQLAVDGGFAHLAVPPLRPADRQALMAACLIAANVPVEEVEPLADASRTYSLGIEQVSSAATFAGQRAVLRVSRKHDSTLDDEGSDAADRASSPVPNRTEIRLACSTAATDRLRLYGSRVEGSARWEDVVLPDETREQLLNISRFARVRDRLFDSYGFGKKHDYGRALSAMFSGPSGTGKTMCAGLVARDVGLELYRVDLSRVVSKYIGETEQRLGALFDEATQVGAALLFDEADSLFGKRTEIKSSHDRYANLEVNYLLQRLEEFDGLVMLTTNFATSIDEAFVRRLRFRVDFPFPSPEDRSALWARMLPPELPLDEEDPLELDWMGESFELSGGHIKNATLRAGMMSADSEGGLSMRMLYDAAAAEYRELGKIAPAYAFEEEDW